jgi:hypothetical protein
MRVVSAWVEKASNLRFLAGPVVVCVSVSACASAEGPTTFGSTEDAEPPLSAQTLAGPDARGWPAPVGGEAGVAEIDADRSAPSVGPEGRDASAGRPDDAGARAPTDTAVLELADAAVAEVPAVPDAATCLPEACNGRDDDCDGAIDEEAGCPCDVVAGPIAGPAESSTYLLCREGRNWVLARQFCQGFGYDLVALEDGAEDTFIYGAIAARGFGGTWLGLNDRAAEGQWVWLDGAPVLYSHWDQGEPNDGGNGGEDCGVVMTGDGRQSEWDDRGCESVRPFVCEAAAP